MGFNLDDEKYDAKGGDVKIFNNGVAGVVDDVTLSVKRKTAEDKENAPNYKLTFSDASGASTDMSFWYVEKDTDYETIEQQVEKQGKKMKHILNAIYGEATRPKVGGETAQQFLDSGMKAINEGLKAGGKFRVFANYGVSPDPAKNRTGKVSKYIGIRTWVPFIESMAVTESRLSKSDLDAMNRVEETQVSAPTANANDLIEGDDW
jgi:hypothetical protein